MKLATKMVLSWRLDSSTIERMELGPGLSKLFKMLLSRLYCVELFLSCKRLLTIAVGVPKSCNLLLMDSFSLFFQRTPLDRSVVFFQSLNRPSNLREISPKLNDSTILNKQKILTGLRVLIINDNK